MQIKLSTALGALLMFLGALHYVMPLSYFFGKRCDVRFQAYLMSNYLDWSKQDRVLTPDIDELPLRDSPERWAFRNILVVGRGNNGSICFAGYRSVKPSARQVPPRQSAVPPLVVQPDGDTFCVQKRAVASVRKGYLGWGS